MSFSDQPLGVFQRAGFSYLAAPAWIAAGFEHGFFGRVLDVSDRGVAAAAAVFANSFSAQRLRLLRQVHGHEFVDLRGSDLGEKSIPDGATADAWIVRPRDENRKMAVGIKTADCLPVIIRAGFDWGVIHAGWRGLADQVVERVADQLVRGYSAARIEVLLGPCAGARRYEVGLEVIDAIGEPAVFKPTGDGKALLSLTDTCIAILGRLGIERANIQLANVCTIDNPDYFSHRREGSAGGRNLTFLMI